MADPDALTSTPMTEDERRVLLERAVKHLEEKISQSGKDDAALLLRIVDRKKDLYELDKTVVAEEIRAKDRMASIAASTTADTLALLAKINWLRADLSMIEGRHTEKMVAYNAASLTFEANTAKAQKLCDETTAQWQALLQRLTETKRDLLAIRTTLNALSL